MCARRTRFTPATLILAAVLATPSLAQNPRNPGIFQQYSAPVSSSLGFLASEAGKQSLLHSPSPMALPLLTRFHPDAVSQYPQEPLMQPGPIGRPRPSPAATVTGCGTASGTVMNLEPAPNAVTQREVSVDFLLSELGAGKDLVAEHATDYRGEFGTFDSLTAVYVHRDGTVPCYGGTDFEMANPKIADPFNPGDFLFGAGNARLLADPTPAHKQFILADMRFNGTTAGIGLRRIPASNFESTTTCPAGTLNQGQETTCAGSTAILVDASLDNVADTPSIAQDPRSTGTGAGDIYIVDTSFRELRTVIVLTACKATFTTSADCSTPIVVSGGTQRGPHFSSIAVLGGGPNAGTITMTYVDGNDIEFIACVPHGAPAHPTCGALSTVISDSNLYSSLTDNPSIGASAFPVIAARTDASGQTVFVVWSDCKVSPFQYPLEGCPDADIVMSVDLSISSPSWTFRHVNTEAGHQASPSIAYDTGQNTINIAYYSTGFDLYKNDVRMVLNQIASGTTTVGSPTNITTSYDSTTGDGTIFASSGNPFGDYMGLAARGGTGSGSSRVYLGFTNNARQGTYGTVSNTQADNNISRATY